MKKIPTIPETKKEKLPVWPDDITFATKSRAPRQPDPLVMAGRRRDDLLAKEAWLTSKQVASAVHEIGADEYAKRLRGEKRLFAVRYRGEYLHPAFQFLPNGEVHPAMVRLLKLLPTTEANWAVAFWLYQPTGLLGGRRPADVFPEDPDAVVLCAEKDFVRRDDEF